MKGAVVVFSRLTAKPGRRDALLALLAPLVDAAKEEPGTECFVIHVARDDADVAWSYERFADEAAFTAHRDSTAVRAVLPKIRELLALSPEVTFATPKLEARR